MDHLVWWDEEMMAAYRTENSPAARTLQEIGVHSSVSIYSSVPMNLIQTIFVGTQNR
jgi:hypothetical protein